jgi:hypothetical protein
VSLSGVDTIIWRMSLSGVDAVICYFHDRIAKMRRWAKSSTVNIMGGGVMVGGVMVDLSELENKHAI